MEDLEEVKHNHAKHLSQLRAFHGQVMRDCIPLAKRKGAISANPEHLDLSSDFSSTSPKIPIPVSLSSPLFIIF